MILTLVAIKPKYRYRMPLLNILPFIKFQYFLGHELIDYCEMEKDLGIHIDGSLNFTPEILLEIAKKEGALFDHGAEHF